MTKSAPPATSDEENNRAAETRRKTKQPAARTKEQHLIPLLGLTSGADITRLGVTLGWQPHTTRAAITGLRKARYEIETKRTDAGRPVRYRIVAHPRLASRSNAEGWNSAAGLRSGSGG